jgi:predicted metal-dependent enzyme (double-stranded beta helix superfamily)
LEAQMTTSQRLPAFEKFIQELRATWSELPDTEARMRKSTRLLEELVKDPSLKHASKSWPSTEGRKNLLFYEDPDYHFAINGVVRVPGRKGSIHDHAHAWTAYGILDGTETLERFRRVDDRSKDGYAKLELESVTEGEAGKVDLVPPFDIHAEQGGPARSVAIILRSERVAGKTTQGSYDIEKQTIRQIDGPIQVPYEIIG